MGYEYDYVFDWMVKKPNVPNSITANKNEEDKQNDNDGGNLNNSG